MIQNKTVFYNSNSGNFLIQSLLAIALIISFMPMLVKKIALSQQYAEMSATTEQIETATVAGKIFMTEMSESLNVGVKTLSGDNFSDTLEPFGLPLGFTPKTPFNQNIDLIILKSQTDSIAFLRIYGGTLSKLNFSELIARIGFWAGIGDKTTIKSEFGGWEIDTQSYGYIPDAESIYVRIPIDNEFSELVKKRSKTPENDEFLSDLIMNKFDINTIGAIDADSAVTDSANLNTLTLTGVEDGRKIKNKIESISAARAIFQDGGAGNAMAVSKGTLIASDVFAKTISNFGSPGTIQADTVSIYDFAMAAGKIGFYGPEKWSVIGNLVLENVNLDADNITINSYLNAARGQDAFIDDDGLSYTTQTGIDTDTISATHITLRDQISSALSNGETGPTIIDIRPAGTSILPDVLLDELNNDSIIIISDPADNTGQTTNCRNIIKSFDDVDTIYNSKSVAQNIICQYVFLQRLERRIDIKKCMDQGKSNCEN